MHPKFANLAKIEQSLAKSQVKTDLFVFPEANIIGGFWEGGEEDYLRLAEKIPEGYSCQKISELTIKYKTTICCGIIEKYDGKYFVTHFLCGPKGYIGKQRKLYPNNPGKKDGYFSSGNTLHIFELFGNRCQILACADILLPEGSILSGLENIPLIISPLDCFGQEQREIIKQLIRVRAMDSCANIVVAFGHGQNTQGKQLLAGLAIDTRGDVLAYHSRDAHKDKIVRIELSLKEPKQVWGGIPARSHVLLKFLQRCGETKQTRNKP